MAFDSRTGSTFAGYRIDSVLGRGGMSVVYLAKDVRLGRNVALKFLSPELAVDPAFRERFTHESRAAANLDHPNIVPVYQAGEADGVLYIAMRHVRGPTLAEVLDGGAIDPERAVAIVEQVAAALDAAHRGGVIHRDVKPANVLLEAQAEPVEREHAYLSDFGLTKTTTSSGGLTKTGQFLGTVDYVAPEQIQGAAVDGRADVYALGCVLFETLTGRPPFRREAEVATLVAHLQDPPLMPSATDPALRAFDPVISKALAKNPAERYPTAGELAADARTALRGATAPEAATPARHPRPRLLLMGGAFVAVAAVVVLAFLAFGHGSPGRTGASPSPSPSGSSPGPAAGASDLVSVDPRSLRVRTVPVGVSGAVAAGNGAVWFASHFDVQKFNLVQRVVEAHVPESRVQDLVSTAQGVYGVSAYPFTAVFRIDPATNVPHELSRLSRYESVTCCNPRLAFGEGEVWVINTFGNVMYRFDPTSGKLLGRTHLPNHPTGIAVGDGAVWVAFTGA
ncbi:MAG TPA: hypothetical protein DIT48_08290, partial [Actinobacteria bacterium]|nr:hypothetical protein [Actinomycetota bacterium]